MTELRTHLEEYATTLNHILQTCNTVGVQTLVWKSFWQESKL